MLVLNWTLKIYRSGPIVHANKALEIDPEFEDAHYSRGWAYLYSGQMERGLDEFLTHTWSPFKGYALAINGQMEEANKMLGELEKWSENHYVDPIRFAMVYIGLQEYDEAFRWLDKAYIERSRGLLLINGTPFYDPIRDDPRFKELVQKIGL